MGGSIHELPQPPDNTWSNWASKSLCDPQFFLRAINPLPVVYPMTWRKLGYWGASASALAACIALQVKFEIFSTAANYNNYILLGLICGVDPLVSTLCLITAKYPPANPEPVQPLILGETIDEADEKIIENYRIAEVNLDSAPTSVDESEDARSADDSVQVIHESPYASIEEVDEDRVIEHLSTVITLKTPYVEDIEAVEQMVPVEELVPSNSGYQSQFSLEEVVVAQPCNPIMGSFEPDTDRVGIVIACHNSATRIGATLISCLQHVKPEQIYVIDNGDSNLPADDTYQVVKKIHPNINYIWGHIGNKTMSQYIGTLYASMHGREFILTLDDDMRLERNFRFGVEQITQKCRALFYAIRAVHPEGKDSLIINWQDLEYKLSDLSKLSQARFGGALYPHGAGSLWEAQIFLQVLLRHDAVFYAEDVKLGMLLTQLGYSMGAVAGTTLATQAPTSIFGAPPNLFDQRVCSWEMGRQAYFWKFVRQLFTVKPPSTSILDFSMFKLAEFYAVYCNVVDWWKLPLLLLLVRSEMYWIKLAAFYGASIIPALLWNYIKLPLNHRQDLQVSILTIATHPLFKFIESGMSVLGIFYLLMMYLPNYTPKMTIPEHLASMQNNKEDLERCIEQDQRGWDKLLDDIPSAQSVTSPLDELTEVVIERHPPFISYRTILHHAFFSSPQEEAIMRPIQQDEEFTELDHSNYYEYL